MKKFTNWLFSIQGDTRLSKIADFSFKFFLIGIIILQIGIAILKFSQGNIGGGFLSLGIAFWIGTFNIFLLFNSFFNEERQEFINRIVKDNVAMMSTIAVLSKALSEYKTADKTMVKVVEEMTGEKVKSITFDVQFQKDVN